MGPTANDVENEVDGRSARAAEAASSWLTYVTQLLAASAARADLPSTSFSTSFAVGPIPSQVRMSPDGGTAYINDQDAHTITYVDVATNQAVGARKSTRLNSS